MIEYIQDPHHPERMEIKRTSKQVNHVQAMDSTHSMHLLTAPHLGASDLQRQFANVQNEIKEADVQQNLAPKSKSNVGRQRSWSAGGYNTMGRLPNGAAVHFDGRLNQADTQDAHVNGREGEGMRARPTSASVYSNGGPGAWQSKMEGIWEERFAALGGGSRKSVHVGENVGHMRPESAPVRNLSHNMSSDRWRTGENPTDKVYIYIYIYIYICTHTYICTHICIHTNVHIYVIDTYTTHRSIHAYTCPDKTQTCLRSSWSCMPTFILCVCIHCTFHKDKLDSIL